MSNDERDYNRTPLGDSIDIASMRIFKKSYELSPDKNFVASPLGVLTLITLYASSSDGKHDEEIMSLLGSIDRKQFSESFSQLIERFSSIDPNPLNFGNEVVLCHDDMPSEESGNEDQKTEMNKKWAARVTKGVNENPDAVINFLNDIFFQGHWHVPFNENNTWEEEFHVDKSTTVMKPMMHLEQPLFYTANSDMAAQMIELPYQESKFRMIVVLPNQVDGLPVVIQKASESGLLEDIFQLDPTRSEVNLSMPKFEAKSKTNFNLILPEGIASLLQRGRPSGLKNRPEPPTSRAHQEVHIKINEEGATAGAFTGRVRYPRSIKSKPPTPIPFKVNRPFLYVILHDDIIIFVGTYTD